MSSRNGPGNAPHGSSLGKKPSKSQVQKQQAAKRAMAAASGAKAARNKRLMQVVAPIVAVIVVVGILIAVSATQGKKKANTTSTASQAVTAAVTNVPTAVTNKAGISNVAGPSKQLTGAALTADGKPKVLYVGAEWCPFCAAERWPLAEALSRFGTLTNLGETKSAPDDSYPNTATLSFHGSKYSSNYIALTAAEIQNGDRQPQDKISKADSKLFTTIGGSGFPFIDLGGKYQFGYQYDPQLLSGKTQAQIADAMSDPSSDIGTAIDASANYLTAAICSLTDDQPSNVCTASGVVAAKAKLDAKS